MYKTQKKKKLEKYINTWPWLFVFSFSMDLRGDSLFLSS